MTFVLRRYSVALHLTKLFVAIPLLCFTHILFVASTFVFGPTDSEIIFNAWCFLSYLKFVNGCDISRYL